MKSHLLSAVCVLVLVSSGAVHSVTFTGLGASFAEISPDGSFVFNSTSRWTSTGGWETWDSYSGGSVTGGVSAVSYDGSVVAGTLNDDPYRWTASTGMIDIGSFPSSYSFLVSGISDDGGVIAGTAADTNPNNDDSQAYRWTLSTGMVGLGLISNGSPEAWSNDVSADGSAVLGTDVNTTESGYWAADGTWTPITGVLANPTAASSNASAIIGDNNGRSVFRWTSGGGFGDLGVPILSPFREYANDISSDGSIVVGEEIVLAGSQNGAWVWDEINGRRLMSDVLIDAGIDLTGWDLLSAVSISADGSIITGRGTGPGGVSQAWVADFSSAVPIPAALWLFGSGLLGLVGMVRRKKTA